MFVCRIRIIVATTVALACWLGSHEARAQISETQAIVARPMNVAAVTFQVSNDESLDTENFSIEDPTNRVLYPVFSSGRLSRLIGDVLGAEAGGRSRTVFFLFTETNPLEVTIYTPAPQKVVVQPSLESPRATERLLTRWWREYYASASALAGDYPPVIETFLTGMLERRLGMQQPLISRITQSNKSQLRRTMDLLLSTEDMHLDTIRQTMTATQPREVADQPLPREIRWTPPAVIAEANVAVEPIAHHVPEECFYVRFGSFENYIWLEDLLTAYGGDIARMVSARGQDPKLGDRMRNQLATPVSAMAKIVGGRLIGDVALIGKDLYLQDGAAVGVLFHARNSGLLRASLQQQRLASASAEKANGAVLETVSIQGKDVSYLSTPDNRLRSFYAVDGDFHLVTTSRAIVERFFECGTGERSMAASPEFLHARSRMPLDRNDTVFAFFSTSFFSGLVGVQYQIELGRRLQAITDLELVQLGQLAATGEGFAAPTIDALVGAEFLPEGFGQNTDGSGPIVEETRVIDSKRGARGTFTPIPDVELDAATATEVALYNQRAAYFSEQWRQLDPLMVAVKRETGPQPGLERLVIDANISPLAEQKYGWVLSMLGPPVTQQIAPREGEIVSMQAYVTGGQASNLIPPHLLFLGIQDSQTSFDLNPSGMMQILRVLRTTPGFLGAWPKPGFLDWLPIRPQEIPPDGFTRLLFDVWRWQGEGFSLLSFHRGILESTIPQLRIEETDNPAQARMHVGDISQSQLRDWINWLYYQRAKQISIANARLLESMTQQLRLPPDQALPMAEKLLDTRLVCPLGGQYELATSNGRQVWQSTAWARSPANGAVPEDYRAPILQWFRGLDFSLTKSGEELIVHADILMEPSVKKSNSLFDVFGK